MEPMEIDNNPNIVQILMPDGSIQKVDASKMAKDVIEHCTNNVDHEDYGNFVKNQLFKNIDISFSPCFLWPQIKSGTKTGRCAQFQYKPSNKVDSSKEFAKDRTK
jgi:hypothetical protein